MGSFSALRRPRGPNCDLCQMRKVTTCFGASAFGTARMFSKSVSPAEGRKVSLDRPECDCCSDDALGVNGAEIATVETRRMLGE